MTAVDVTATFTRVAGRRPFAALALTLYLFTTRLDRNLRGQSATSVAFLAREGKFLKELFDAYQVGCHPPGQRISSTYVLTSRRASYLASLPSVVDDAFEGFDAMYPSVSPLGFLASLGLRDDDIETITSAVADIDGMGLAELRSSPTFRTVAESYRDEQRSLLARHLDHTLVDDRGVSHLVDVGWKGSMQDFLGEVVSPGRQLAGWYVGLVQRPSSPVDVQRSPKVGLLFDSRLPNTPEARTFRHFKSLFEVLLNADHGSVIRYEQIGGVVTPILDDESVEVCQHRELIAPVQLSLKHVFDGLVAELGAGLVDDAATVRTVARHHGRMVFTPSADEIAVFEGFEHYENFGEVGHVEVGVGGGSSRHPVRSLVTVLRDPRSIYRSGWPPLQLRREGLGWLVPLVGRAQLVRAFPPGFGRSGRR